MDLRRGRRPIPKSGTATGTVDLLTGDAHVDEQAATNNNNFLGDVTRALRLRSSTSIRQGPLRCEDERIYKNWRVLEEAVAQATTRSRSKGRDSESQTLLTAGPVSEKLHDFSRLIKSPLKFTLEIKHPTSTIFVSPKSGCLAKALIRCKSTSPRKRAGILFFTKIVEIPTGYSAQALAMTSSIDSLL